MAKEILRFVQNDNVGISRNLELLSLEVLRPLPRLTKPMRLESPNSAMLELRACAFGALPYGILCADRNSLQLIDANDAACRMLGYSCDELLGMNLGSICSDEDASAIGERLERAWPGRLAATPIQLQQRRKDGHLVPVEWHASALASTRAEWWIIMTTELSVHSAALADARGAGTDRTRPPDGSARPANVRAPPVRGAPTRRRLRRL